MKDYKLHEMELAEYTRVFSHSSHIDVCIWIDESHSYVRWQHPLWVIISRGDPYVDKWFALPLENMPKIPLDYEKLDIRLAPLIRCRRFVSRLALMLRDIADEKVDSSVLYRFLEKYDWRTPLPKDIETIYSTFKLPFLLDKDEKR